MTPFIKCTANTMSPLTGAHNMTFTKATLIRNIDNIGRVENCITCLFSCFIMSSLESGDTHKNVYKLLEHKQALASALLV